jgi:hypothetical protein
MRKLFVLLSGLAACGGSSNGKASVEAGAHNSKTTRPPLEFMGARVGDPMPGDAICLPSRLGQQSCQWSTQPKIGSAWIKQPSKIYLDGKLVTWGFTMDVDAFDAMSAAFSKKYGAADTSWSGTTPSPTGSGATAYAGNQWWFADGELNLGRAIDNERPDQSYMFVQAFSATKSAEHNRRVVAADSAAKAAEAAATLKDLNGH